MNRMLVFTLAVAVGGSASGQDQIIITPPGEDPFLTPPGNAVAWQVRNDDPAHIDGPFAIPGRLNHLGRPVVMDPMLPLTATPFGSAFWGTGVGCVLFHLHTDPAPPNPPTAPPYALFDDGSGLAAGFHPDPDRGPAGTGSSRGTCWECAETRTPMASSIVPTPHSTCSSSQA